MIKKVGMLPIIIIILSLILSGVQGAVRFLEEKKQKDIQILVNYSDIKKASEIYEYTIAEITEQLKEAGVTGVLVKEQTIKATASGAMTSWEEQGKVTVFTGAELKLLGTINGIDLTDIIPSHYYLWIPDGTVRSMIKEHISNKLEVNNEINISNQVFLDAGYSSNAIVTLGTGYPKEDLEIIASKGLYISPQIRSWSNVTEESLEYVLNDIKSFPNLGTVYFNDSTVPGYKLPIMNEFAKNNPVGMIEFFSEKQEGLYSLLRSSSHGGEKYNTIRLHTVTDGETSTLRPEQVVDRYLLATTERNMKALLVKMPNTSEPNKDYNNWFEIINNISSNLNKSGYSIVSNPKPINIPISNPIMIWIIGFGPIFLLVLYGQWIDKEKWSWILVFIGLLGWTGLLKLNPTIARQAMALAAAILYPTWAVITCMKEENSSWKQALLSFIKLSFISLGGALTIIGLLSQTTSVLTIDMFRGVKVAHVIPLMLVLILIEYKRGKLEPKNIKQFLLNPITYLTLLIIGMLGIVLIIYIQRTGNTGQTSSYEIMIRNALDKILGVRPRTKEFLIGHPLMLMMLYYGYKEKYFPLLLGAAIGQISLVNTYAHIHTPIMISLIRSFHGIWIGIIGGIVLIVIIEWIKRIGRRWGLWEI